MVYVGRHVAVLPILAHHLRNAVPQVLHVRALRVRAPRVRVHRVLPRVLPRVLLRVLQGLETRIRREAIGIGSSITKSW